MENNLENVIAIEYVDIDLLKMYPGNPRKFNDASIKEMMNSLQEHGFASPLLVNTAPGRENVILSGNLRLVASQRLKLKKVPVVKLHIVDQRKEQDLLLKMNISNGEWDYDLLKSFDIEIVVGAGFKDLELANIFDDTLETEDDNFNVMKALNAIKQPKARNGDLFQIGNHMILCADSLDENMVSKLMHGNLADMVYTDSPFNIGLDYNGGLGGKSAYGGHVDDKKTDIEFREFLKKSIQNAIRFTKPDAHYFYYSDPNYVWLIQTLYHELGIKPVRTCLWIKNGLNPTPKQAFNRCYEPVIYGVRNRPYISPKCPNLTEILNREIATGNRQNDDLLDQLDIWMVKRISGQDYTHPTEKPPTLHEKALRRCTKPGDIVLDFFGGSGSLMVACEQLKRTCLMVEKEPIFVDLIINRMELLTGKNAKKISGGQDGKQ